MSANLDLPTPTSSPLRRSFTRRLTQRVHKTQLKKCISSPPPVKASRSLENLARMGHRTGTEIVRRKVTARPEERAKLMPDWELTGTKNGWVCPSDRQLTLRAQLKAGWSVRSQQRGSGGKKTNQPALTDAEQQQIKAVLDRSKQIDNLEQVRIGRLVDRLETMRDRAVGNGTNQCLLCGAEFGLLGPRSYAAMCNDCRKYVCQRNCGVETYDPRGIPIFLCKLCSETREVLKKSNAWFTGTIPKYVLPEEDAGFKASAALPASGRRRSENPWIRRPARQEFVATIRADDEDISSEEETGNNSWDSRNKKTGEWDTQPPYANDSSARRRLPATPNTERCRRSPAPTPRWAMEKRAVRSSVSSSEEDGDFGHTLPSTSSAMSLSKPRWHTQTPSLSTPPPVASAAITTRISCKRIKGLSDSESEVGAESRSPTPPSSPRGSLQTPNSVIEDQTPTQIHGDASDSKSVDSGVVQSDHSHTTTTSNSRPNSLQAVQYPPVVHVSSMPPSHSLTLSNQSDADAESEKTGTTVQARQTSSISGESLSLQRKTSIESATPNLLSSPDDDSTKRSRTTSLRRSLSRMLHVSRWYSSSSQNHLTVTPPSSASSRRSSYNSTKSTNDQFGNLGTLQFSLTFDEAAQTLSVYLIGAKNLKPMDSNGLSDPYVVIHLLPGGTKSTKHRSKTIEKTLNPEWDEQIMLHGVSEEDRLKKTLQLTVMDQDRIGADFEGETRVPLRKLTSKKLRQFNVYLEKQKPVEKVNEKELERGKILISLMFSSQNQALQVGIVRCAELHGMDSSGYSDPYVKIALKPATCKKHHAKTRVKKKNLNPEFHEEFTLPVASNELPNKSLLVTVFDKDVGKQDDYIGGIELSNDSKGERLRHWTSVLQHPGSKIQRWHKLSSHTFA